MQYPGLIQSDDHIVADQKGGHPAQAKPGKLRIGFGVGVDVLFGEAYLVLGKELFRRPAMGSGFSGKHDYFLHKTIPLLLGNGLII